MTTTPTGVRPKGSWALTLAYRYLKLILPRSHPEESGIDLYASAMSDHYNWLFRLIFPRFFAKIHFELTHRDELLAAARDGIVVYVGKSVGLLEYHYYAHLFRSLGLPLATFANNISTRRWLPWRTFLLIVQRQAEELTRHGAFPDPIASGFVTDLVCAGKSVLINLPSAVLEDDVLFRSESHQPLAAIVAAAARSSRPIFFVPLDFIWDKRPTRTTRSLVDILFGETEEPGSLRKIILFWRHYKRRALVRIGQPIPFATIATDLAGTPTEVIARLRHRLLDAIRIERRATTGPPIRPRSWFIEQVLEDEHLGQTLAEMTIANDQSSEDVWLLAAKYIDEIAANIDYTAIELMNRFLSWLFRSIFDRIVVDPQHIQTVKRLAATRPVILVPNHKSHLDYLLISHLLHGHNMIVPHIAAGTNLSFWPLGPLFRRGGAYFIRRTFRRNRVYRAVLETYLRLLLTQGYLQEFFIEGGRSRSGKLGQAKLGMLTMLLTAADQGRVTDLTFVPVAITYDRVLEQKSYIAELEGSSKRAERPQDLIKLTKYLKRRKPRYGMVHVRFGQSIAAADEQGEFSERVRRLADIICHGINAEIVLTPVALAAAALLSPGRRGVTVAEVMRRADSYLAYLRHKKVVLAERLSADPRSSLAEALAQLSQGRFITLHEDSRDPFYAIPEDKRTNLDYIKNSCIHYFASIAVLARLIRRRGVGKIEIGTLVRDFSFCQQLFAREFRFSTRRNVEDHIQHLLAYLTESGALSKNETGAFEYQRDGDPQLVLFADLVENYFESYRLTFEGIAPPFAQQEIRSLAGDIRSRGEHMLLLEKIHRRESLSRWNAKNAIDAFVKLRYVREERLAESQQRIVIASSPPPSDLQEMLERIL